jgi:hypothetical protein
MNEYNEDFRIEADVLYVRLSGKFPKEILGRQENLFEPLIRACSTHNCRKALIDARDLQVDFDTMALLRAGEDAAFLTHLGLWIAFVAREDMRDGFFDNVISNRGGRVGIFTEIDAARDWLKNCPQEERG